VIRMARVSTVTLTRAARWPDVPDARPEGLLDRALRPFGDVRRGEGMTAALLIVTLFLILSGYYVCKTVREPLILTGGGAEMKAYAAGLQALALMAFVPAYSWLAARVSRMTLVVSVTLFFVANLELFWLAGQFSVPYLGIAFFVWAGIFNNAIVSQFWSYGNDLYTPDQGARLFPVIAIGATLGSPVGAWVAGQLFEAGVPALHLLQLAVIALLLSLACYLMVERRHPSTHARSREGGLRSRDGFALLASNPYLRLICLLLLVLNVVNTTGEYILSRAVVSAAEAAVPSANDAAREAYIGAFYGSYFFWVNIVAIVVQSVLVSRLVRVAGIAGVLFVLPIASLVTYATALSGASLNVFRWTKTVENGLDYSAMNTARQMLWLPTSRAEKYAAKQAADTFVVRAGDVVAAGLVYAGTTWLSLDRQGFSWAILVVIAVWMGVAWLLVNEYRRRRDDGHATTTR
jgi:AAA family ATP:ADP antiporter